MVKRVKLLFAPGLEIEFFDRIEQLVRFMSLVRGV
jgi:hypothetical protein